jgi:hypothetical protein
MSNILQLKALNKWGLFTLFSVPISLLVIIEMLRVDLSTGAGVSEMIGYSVRWAIPFIYFTIAASSAHILFPGEFSKWWLRNRKYVGLVFALAMFWQGVFIFTMSTFFRDYYFENIYYFRDELEGSVGYIFLGFMVLTSFPFARKKVNLYQWTLIQKAGIYFLWAYPFSVYWWNLYYYKSTDLLDYVLYWSGFLAFAMRIAAWGKSRISAASSDSHTPLAYKYLGILIICFGLVVASTGLHWQSGVTTLFTATTLFAYLELWLPFWPFEPFLSLFIIGFGTMVMTHTVPSSITLKAA